MSTSRSIGDRAVAVAALAVAVALLLSGCGSGSRLGPILAKGASEASIELKPLSDDLLHAAQSGSVETPGALKQAAQSIPASGVSEADRAAAAAVERWLKTVEFWNGAVKWSTGWESGLPAESVALVGAALRRGAKPAFARQLDDLTARLLRSATCQTARQYIDDAAKDAEAGSTLAFDPADPVDEPGMTAFANSVLTGEWTAESVDATVDLAALASSIVSKAKQWETALTAVYEAPNGAIRQADVFYLRSCVMRA